MATFEKSIQVYTNGGWKPATISYSKKDFGFSILLKTSRGKIFKFIDKQYNLVKWTRWSMKMKLFKFEYKGTEYYGKTAARYSRKKLIYNPKCAHEEQRGAFADIFDDDSLSLFRINKGRKKRRRRNHNHGAITTTNEPSSTEILINGLTEIINEWNDDEGNNRNDDGGKNENKNNSE